ncbi:zinc-ribbon domain-containing protein [Bifidobacterium sp. ESL0764]|uniref:zinc ribbon domain-containing protein n=1 Tax=Bifidobacterium sp. ESL0764 TaxID=2983228 RepID=UPI0023F7B462|nr:zinc-ribbon domain-containing protein [Bifidobacterium sp. ESL0764]WEV65674.1 zinc ribbon domain-containing protein [Bifidobacterium sp. ESL0764]
MKRCVSCGANLDDGAQFCSNCGSAQGGASASAAQTACPKCGTPVNSGMRFCQVCGTPLTPAGTPNAAMPQQAPASAPAMQQPAMPPIPMPQGGAQPTQQFQPVQLSQPAQPAPTQQFQPVQATVPTQSAQFQQGYVQPNQPSDGYADTSSQAGSNGVAEPEASDGGDGDGDGKKTKKGRKKWIAILAIIVVIALIAAGGGLWWHFKHGSDASGSSKATTSVSRKHKAKDSKSKKVGKEVKASGCQLAPKATLSGVDHSDTTMLASFDLDTKCDKQNQAFKRDKVKVIIEDSNAVVASAVYDFSKQPIAFKGGSAKVTLAYSLSQYWRPFDEIEISETKVTFQPGEAGNGSAAKNVKKALGGADVRDSDIERYSKEALKWQTDHDESRGWDFHSDVFTTQISSKKEGMKAGGKTWEFHDIEQEFLANRIKYPKAILIWGKDFAHYTQNGADASYYVTLSGEPFSDKDAGSNWCKSNNLNADSCMAVKTGSDD